MNKPTLTTVYAHKFHDGEVVVYADELGMRRMATYPSYFSNKPDRRYKYTTINCARYKLAWI